MSAAKRDRIALVGFMATGKTSFGKVLARRLRWKFVDCDAEIVKAERMRIPQIFASKGEAYFRRAESRALARALKSKNTVISTGGGAVIAPANRRALKRGAFVVWMRSPLSWILKRAAKQAKRPLLSGENPAKAALKLLKTRTPMYRACSDASVWTRETAEITRKAPVFLKRNGFEGKR